MSSFCYFLPNIYAAQLAPQQQLARSLLAERGLADLLADVDLPHAGVADLAHGGPGKLCGCVLAPHTAAGDVPRLGYFPELQDWTPSIGGEQQYWLGRDRDQPTTAESLRRRRPLVRGYDLTLGDGQVWHVPVVRRPTGSTHLPCHLVMRGPGQLEDVVKAEYRALFDDFEPVATIFWEGGRLERLVGCDLALRALAVNYRLGWNEQNLLRLLDGENWREILKLAVDLPLFDEALQKKRALA